MTDQRARMDRAYASMMDGMETFIEIMGGSNPLSPAEIRKLAEKRPEKYGKFLKYAERMESSKLL